MILVVDDDEAITKGVAVALESRGYAVVRCHTASEALTLARVEPPDLALVDIRLNAEDSGIHVASVLRTELGVPVIFMTAFGDEETISRATHAGAAALLLKPVTDQDLRCATEIALARHRILAKAATAERIATAASLANGLAHEVNNPLAFLTASLEYAVATVDAMKRDPQRSLEQLGSVARALSDAIEGAERIRSVVADITTFARAQVPVPERVDLGATLRAAWAIACGDAKERRHWQIDVADLPPIEGDEVQLVQLFTRLLQNAVDHRRSEGPHRVALRAHADERGVTVEIEDTGRGIPRELHSRIFDPFFTTRGAKAGRGLGLAIAGAIVRAHFGEIGLESRVGVGTTVTVWLPREAKLALGSDTTAPKVTSERPRVLVVDDEPAIGRSIKRMLKGEYEVHTVGDGSAALTELGRATYDAILCDITLPGMDGTDLYAEIRRRHPALASRIVFVTGGTFSARSQAFLDSLPNKTIRKPFAVEEIRSALREVLR